MGIEVDDQHIGRGETIAEMSGKAEEAAIGDLVTAAENDGPDIVSEQACYAVGKAGLGRFQIPVAAFHVTGIVEACLPVDGKPHQHVANRGRTRGRTHPPMIASHALVAGKSENGGPTRYRQNRMAG